MTQRRRALGRSGEARASRFLESLGWRVLARGARGPFGELDIVAQDGDTVVFVEVKARTGRRAGSPEEAVDFRKQSRIVRCALAYVRDHRLEDRRLRFDVVAVDGGELRHHRGAFTAEGYTL